MNPTDQATPLTQESVDLLADVYGTQMSLTVYPSRLRAIEAAAARRAIEGSGVVEADELLELLIGILAEGPNGEYATIDAMERAAKAIHMEWHEAQGRWVTTDRTRPYRAARRAIEGSGVVSECRHRRISYVEVCCVDCNRVLNKATLAYPIPALAALPRPEEPRVERCAVCGETGPGFYDRHNPVADCTWGPDGGPCPEPHMHHPFTPEAR